MVSNIEYIKLGITIITFIITSVTGILMIYHKFIVNQIEKKVDQKLHDKEVEYMKIQIKYNYSNLKEKIETLSSDVKVIKESILSNQY